MPAQGLLNLLSLGRTHLHSCISRSTSQCDTCSGDLLTVARQLLVVKLSLEILLAEVLIEIAICQDGVRTYVIVDGLQQHPATDKAVGIGLCCCGIGSNRLEVAVTVLELYPVDADFCIPLTSDTQVGNTLRHILQIDGLCEPLVTLVTTELPHLGDDIHRHTGNNLTLGILLTDAEFSITTSLGIDDEVGIGNGAEVYIGIVQPAAFLRQGGLIAAEGIDSIDERCRHITAGSAVAVYLNLLGSLVDTHTTHGLLDFLDSTVGVEIKLLDTCGATLVITRREVVVVVEQVPLALVVDDAMVISPTAVRLLGHDQPFILIRTHGVLTHRITKHLRILTDIRIGQVIPTVGLKGKGTLGLTVGQVFQTVDTQHLKLTVAPLDFLLGGIVSQLLHIGLELGTTACTPKDVGIAVRSLEHTGVDTIDALDGFGLTDERSLGTVSNSNTDTEATTIFRS